MELKVKADPVLEEPSVSVPEEPIMASEENEHVFDLESSEGINQINLFGTESEEDQVKEYEFEPTLKADTPDAGNNISDDDSIDFDFPETEETTKEPEEYSFDFAEGFELSEESAEEEDHNLEELDTMAHPPSKKLQLMEARRIREEALAETKNTEQITGMTFKEKWDVPAYERKNVVLQQVPHSSERNISKFNLTDDNQIVGNNRFLHDNVD
jgi:cell division protein FtsZ